MASLQRFGPAESAKLFDDAQEPSAVSPRREHGGKEAPKGAPHAASGAKTSKFLDFCAQLTLRNVFQLLGMSIGNYPFAFLIASAIIASSSLGMYQLKLKDRVRDGYTPATSASRHETDVFREFMGSGGDPVMTTVLLRSKDGGSMHRLSYLAEADRIHSFLLRNLTAQVPGTGESYRYEDICGPYCATNVVINYFYRAVKADVSLLRRSLPRSNANLSYPIATVEGFEMHLERNFFGVHSYGNASVSEDPEVRELATVTSFDHVGVIMMVFRGDFSSAEMETKLNTWEMTVYNYVREEYNHSNVEMLVMGTEIVDNEMNQDSQRMTPYFATGFCVMLAFAATTVLSSAFYFDVLDIFKLLVAVGTTLCPIFAITSTFGICAIAGLRTNSLLLIMPFLIMGIGVNDSFLMIHAWYRLAHKNLGIAERLGLVLEDVGPSITITTLTNVITFGIGALTPTPEISLFCLGTAIALGFAYIFSLILFGPILYFATRYEMSVAAKRPPTADPKARWSHRFGIGLQRLLRLYCQLLGHKFFALVLLLGSLVYWYFAIWGTLNINTKLDTEKILPADSPIQEPHRVMSHSIWTEYYPVTVLVNNEVDIADRSHLARFEKMVSDFESMPLCRGPTYTLLWLRDYEKYTKMARDWDFNFYDDETTDDTAQTVALPEDPSRSHLDYTHLHEFLQSPFHKHWASFLRLQNATVPVRKFWFLVTYHRASSWDDRIRLMQEWREVAARYPDLNVTVWETNSMFVDQMLSLKSLALQTGVWTLVCMAVVCALFIQNPLSVCTATLAIASISLGVIGYLSWWHLDLDPVTLCAVLMSIGMSVDFTAHVSYNFQLRHRKEISTNHVVKIPLDTRQEKLRHTIESVAWPMVQAGLSTVVCILPLCLLQNYIPLVFVKTISLVVIWGLWHGLVVLPTFLAALPLQWIRFNCYRSIFQKATAAPPSEEEIENENGHELSSLA
ncbi:hypothetical protein QR680_000749 [Steinernema hermaphroditum]|uniref:SSD domain-containing protein n=1 Tax=Steinernema hermaphroditum TaxID=289476 RepID=A0AA39LEV2_9BILA|nr:hypothetical protein QR680_000749 [Steinernema hermaphroditum]